MKGVSIRTDVNRGETTLCNVLGGVAFALVTHNRKHGFQVGRGCLSVPCTRSNIIAPKHVKSDYCSVQPWEWSSQIRSAFRPINNLQTINGQTRIEVV